MKYLILMAVLLSGCGGDNYLLELHATAKMNPDKEICYNLYNHKAFSGRYCTKYVGNISQ